MQFYTIKVIDVSVTLYAELSRIIFYQSWNDLNHEFD